MTLVTVDNKSTNSAKSVNLTLRDIIYEALYRLNIYSIRETPQDNEVASCVKQFNSMLQGWFLQDIVVSFNDYDLDDTPSLNIGTTNPLYYDDCFIDNLSLRLITIYNLDSRAFRDVSQRANKSLNIVTNLKRDKEYSENTFKSEFDKTLKNSPDIDRTYNYLMTD